MVNVRTVVRRTEVILHASVFHMRSIVLFASIVPRTRLALVVIALHIQLVLIVIALHIQLVLGVVAPHTQLTLASIELHIQLVSISDECYADDWYGLATLLEVQLV